MRTPVNDAVHAIPLERPAHFILIHVHEPVRFICYVAAIVAVAVVAKILTHLFVPPSPSPLHTPLTTVRNLLLPGGWPDFRAAPDSMG